MLTEQVELRRGLQIGRRSAGVSAGYAAPGPPFTQSAGVARVAPSRPGPVRPELAYDARAPELHTSPLTT